MYAIAMALVGAAILLWQVVSNAPKQEMTFDAITSSAMANNFWAYRGAVGDYQFRNPAASGAISDSNLVFPLGYQRNALWSNTIQAGVLYTYSNQPLPSGVVKAIADRGGNTLVIGIARTNVMTSLTSAVSFTIPPMIPNGAVVVVGN